MPSLSIFHTIYHYPTINITYHYSTNTHTSLPCSTINIIYHHSLYAISYTIIPLLSICHYPTDNTIYHHSLYHIPYTITLPQYHILSLSISHIISHTIYHHSLYTITIYSYTLTTTLSIISLLSNRPNINKYISIET